MSTHHPSTPSHPIRSESVRKRSNLSQSHYNVPSFSPGPGTSAGGGSPYTPAGRQSSLSMLPYYSPSASDRYRSDEDTLIFEFGARFMRAGFGGEAHPRACVGFGPETQRRTGDFREFLPGFTRPSILQYNLSNDDQDDYQLDSNDPSDLKPRESAYDRSRWGCFHELWREDLRSVDLGLVERQLERALRAIDQTFLMVDLHPKKLVALFSSNLPRKLMSIALSVMFERFHQAPSITLIPQPFAATLAAGVRTAVVVDIGWETVRAVVIEEFRTVREDRSVRAGKAVVRRMVETLGLEASMVLANESGGWDDGETTRPQVSLEDAEEVLFRVGWCRPTPKSVSDSQPEDALVEVSLPSISYSPVPISFHRLSDPIEYVLFNEPRDWRTVDDHERALHILVYDLLRSVGVDTRTVAMGRIIVTGGIANIPGVKGRLKYELERTVREKGWVTGPIRGSGCTSSQACIPTPVAIPASVALESESKDDGSCKEVELTSKTTASPKLDPRPKGGSEAEHYQDDESTRRRAQEPILAKGPDGTGGDNSENPGALADASISLSPSRLSTTEAHLTSHLVETNASGHRSEAVASAPQLVSESEPTPSSEHGDEHESKHTMGELASTTSLPPFPPSTSHSTHHLPRTSTTPLSSPSASSSQPSPSTGPPPPFTKHIRLIETCGAWAGASLFAPLHLRGAFEVERNAFEEGGLVYALSVHAAASKSHGGGGGSSSGAVGGAGRNVSNAGSSHVPGGGGGSGGGLGLGLGLGPGSTSLGLSASDGSVHRDRNTPLSSGMGTSSPVLGKKTSKGTNFDTAGGPGPYSQGQHRSSSGLGPGSGPSSAALMAGLAGADQGSILAALNL